MLTDGRRTKSDDNRSHGLKANFERGPPKDHSDKVWLKLAKGFLTRRFFAYLCLICIIDQNRQKFKVHIKSHNILCLKGNFAIFFYMLAKYVPGDIQYIFTKFYRHSSTNNEANCKFVICSWVATLKFKVWVADVKFASFIKRSEDYNLNLITVGKFNTEVNSYVPF